MIITYFRVRGGRQWHIRDYEEKLGRSLCGKAYWERARDTKEHLSSSCTVCSACEAKSERRGNEDTEHEV
jgi:hypothetical protein